MVYVTISREGTTHWNGWKGLRMSEALCQEILAFQVIFGNWRKIFILGHENMKEIMGNLTSSRRVKKIFPALGVGLQFKIFHECILGVYSMADTIHVLRVRNHAKV